MKTNIEHQTEQKLEKFNFFKRFNSSKQTEIGFFIGFLKTILKPINYFVTFPAILYILLKPKFPQQALNIANEILTIPSQNLVSLLLIIFGISTLFDLIKQTVDISEDGQKLGKQFTSIWLPLAKTVEVFVLLYLVPILWSILWSTLNQV